MKHANISQQLSITTLFLKLAWNLLRKLEQRIYFILHWTQHCFQALHQNPIRHITTNTHRLKHDQERGRHCFIVKPQTEQRNSVSIMNPQEQLHSLSSNLGPISTTTILQGETDNVGLKRQKEISKRIHNMWLVLMRLNFWEIAWLMTNTEHKELICVGGFYVGP